MWTPAAGSGCQVLRDQLAEAFDAIRSQAGVVPPAQALDPVSEGPVPASRVKAESRILLKQ
jgi:hypothetical protein